MKAMEYPATPDPAAPAAWDNSRVEALSTKLAGYPGPLYKRAYFQGLLGSGLSLLASGNARTAAYCLDKVEAGLREAAEIKAVCEADGEEVVATEVPASHPASPSRSRATRKPKAAGKSALERLRVDWREQRLRQAEDILTRHGSRLTSLERKAYRESLTKWSKAVADAAGSPAASSAARRADHALLDLRRRLYARILKSQKAHIIRLTRPAGSLALVQVHEQFSGPIGPYNDRQNLEGVLTLLAGADPAWVEEFLELYQGLSDLQALIPTVRN